MPSATPNVYHVPDYDIALELCAQEGVIRAKSSVAGSPLWSPSGVIYIASAALNYHKEHPTPPLAELWYAETFHQRVYLVLFERCATISNLPPAAVSDDVNESFDVSTTCYNVKILALEPQAQCRVAWFYNLTNGNDASLLSWNTLSELSLELTAQSPDQVRLRFQLPQEEAREYRFDAAVGQRLV